MDIQSYTAKAEALFQKSEYIAIGHQSFKMLTLPKSFCESESKEIYCFISNGNRANPEICKKLSDYALSIRFYKEQNKGKRIIVVPVFIRDSFSDREKQFISGRCIKTEKAYILNAGIELQNSGFYLTQKLPLIKDKFLLKAQKFTEKAFFPEF